MPHAWGPQRPGCGCGAAVGPEAERGTLASSPPGLRAFTTRSVKAAVGSGRGGGIAVAVRVRDVRRKAGRAAPSHGARGAPASPVPRAAKAPPRLGCCRPAPWPLPEASLQHETEQSTGTARARPRSARGLIRSLPVSGPTPVHGQRPAGPVTGESMRWPRTTGGSGSESFAVRVQDGSATPRRDSDPASCPTAAVGQATTRRQTWTGSAPPSTLRAASLCLDCTCPPQKLHALTPQASGLADHQRQSARTRDSRLSHVDSEAGGRAQQSSRTTR